MFVHQRQGSLEVICGPMFSGKSEELIRRIKRAIIAKQKVQVFKPALDDRYDVSAIASHSQRKHDAIPVKDSVELARHLDPEAQVVALDEVQFMDEGLIPIIEDLADHGVRVIAGGLDQDSNGEPFGIMPILLAKAEYVTKLQAICMVCGALAGRTQRMVQTGGQVLVGAAEAYEARCRHCHETPHATGGRLLEDPAQGS
ncbi:thymidine kinase [Geothrix edaphica]|uniref:Thymidine kinase n=1 Tax=Geothrix edaphica TaxID=2927976 RepID=A0ABQ5PWL4_9BACT|nr:thymidine kinase [Geothrix edaphica]GLH66574.1 thymidine kinase [Geothrix edaphica]